MIIDGDEVRIGDAGVVLTDLDGKVNIPVTAELILGHLREKIAAQSQEIRALKEADATMRGALRREIEALAQRLVDVERPPPSIAQMTDAIAEAYRTWQGCDAADCVPDCKATTRDPKAICRRYAQHLAEAALRC